MSVYTLLYLAADMISLHRRIAGMGDMGDEIVALEVAIAFILAAREYPELIPLALRKVEPILDWLPEYRAEVRSFLLNLAAA